MNKFDNVSIILPAINETYSLEETVKTILGTCNHSDLCELLIVLCKKSTPECIKTAEKIHNLSDDVPVTIYYQKQPFIGMAMREAFGLASGSHVVMMSTDLETPPELVQKFIELAKKEPSKIITASRWIRGGGFEGYSSIKKLLNWIFQKAIGLLFDVDYTDLTYAYRIFPTALVQSIKWEETRHPFFLETALKPIRLGVSLREIPAKWEARTEGVSQNSFFRNFEYFRTALHIRFMKLSDISIPEVYQ